MPDVGFTKGEMLSCSGEHLLHVIVPQMLRSDFIGHRNAVLHQLVSNPFYINHMYGIQLRIFYKGKWPFMSKTAIRELLDNVFRGDFFTAEECDTLARMLRCRI